MLIKKHIKIDLYEWDIYFTISREDHNEALSVLMQKEKTDDFTDNANGIHSCFPANNRWNSVISLALNEIMGYRIKNNKLECEKVLIHEIIHAMQYIKKSLGLNCNENEAVIVSYIYAELITELRKEIIKLQKK